jgi:hypothetical protein
MPSPQSNNIIPTTPHRLTWPEITTCLPLHFHFPFTFNRGLVKYTNKKEKKIFLIYKEIQKGAVAKSYIATGLLIYMTKNLRISSYTVLRIRDPGLGVFLTPGSGMGESQHRDPGSGMNNPDQIF